MLEIMLGDVPSYLCEDLRCSTHFSVSFDHSEQPQRVSKSNSKSIPVLEIRKQVREIT